MTLSPPQTATLLFCLTSEVELKDALGQALLNPRGLDVGVGRRAVRVGRLPVVGLEYQVVALVLLPVSSVLVSPVVVLRGPGPHQPGLSRLALILSRHNVPVAAVLCLEVAVHAGDHGGVVSDGLRVRGTRHPKYLLTPVLVIDILLFATCINIM